MDLGSLFLILALVIFVALFISRPIFEGRRSRRVESAGELGSSAKLELEHSALLAERDRVLNSLQELDFDFAMGKIPEEDYPIQRSILVKRGAEVLQRLDSFESPDQGSGRFGDATDRLETAIAARRSQLGITIAASNGRKGRPGSPDDSLEAQIAARRRQRREKAAGFCPQCGEPVQRSDRFCPKCGTRLKNES